jgi:outer membrane lipoprotein
MKWRILAWLVLVLLGGCTSTVPVLIRTPPPVELSASTVIVAPASFDGEPVRWGGTVTSVENGKTDTLIQVVARPLERGGRPRSSEASPGRFLARVPGFLDPAVYSEGRQVTVAGTLEEPRTQTIGEFPYTFPVVLVREHHLWEPLLPRRPCYLCDPFWWYWEPWDPYRRRW